MIPVRCFTCGAVISDRWDAYVRKEREIADARGRSAKRSEVGSGADRKDGGSAVGKENKDPAGVAKILDELELTRLCCRRHFLANVEMMDDL